MKLKIAGSLPYYGIGAVAVMLAARELEIVHFPLPEWKRQTEKAFAHEFGFVVASLMWGFHIGLGFLTRITYGGFWLLIILALALASPVGGAALISVYWLGRVLSVLIAPVLAKNDGELVEEVWAAQWLFHRVVGVALIWVAGVCLLFPTIGHK